MNLSKISLTEKKKQKHRNRRRKLTTFDGVTEVNLVELEKDGTSQDDFLSRDS